ncbi:MAG: IS110 family transposase [Bifidobacterium pullorum]
MRPPCNVDAGAGRHDRPPTGTRRPERTDRQGDQRATRRHRCLARPRRRQSSHHACALDHDGNTILDTPVDQDEKQLRRTIVKLQRRGTVLVIVDQPNTIGSLPLTVARDMGARTAYLPGDAMRKAAQLLPGGSRTDRRDARIIASTALRMPETLRDCEPDDETMAALRLLSGWDEDTAHELTRTVNRLRGLLLHLHPALERALAGDRIKSDTALGLLEHYKGPLHWLVGPAPRGPVAECGMAELPCRS